MKTYVCARCGLTRTEPFKWGHKPLDSDIRTCGGNVMEVEVDESLAEALRAAHFRWTIENGSNLIWPKWKFTAEEAKAPYRMAAAHLVAADQELHRVPSDE